MNGNINLRRKMRWSTQVNITYFHVNEEKTLAYKTKKVASYIIVTSKRIKRTKTKKKQIKRLNSIALY